MQFAVPLILWPPHGCHQAHASTACTTYCATISDRSGQHLQPADNEERSNSANNEVPAKLCLVLSRVALASFSQPEESCHRHFRVRGSSPTSAMSSPSVAPPSVKSLPRETRARVRMTSSRWMFCLLAVWTSCAAAADKPNIVQIVGEFVCVKTHAAPHCLVPCARSPSAACPVVLNGCQLMISGTMTLVSRMATRPSHRASTVWSPRESACHRERPNRANRAPQSSARPR